MSMTASHADIRPLPLLESVCCRIVYVLAHKLAFSMRILNNTSRVAMQRVDWWLARLKLLLAAIGLRTSKISPLLHHLLLLV